MKYGRAVAKKYPAARKRYNVYAPAVKQLASDMMYIKGLINSEPKYHIVQSSNNINYNGAVISLSTLVQGDGNTHRDGNSVLPRYLSVNIQFGATDAGTQPLTMRMIIFRYWGEKTSSGAPAVDVASVLSTTGSQYAPLSHLNEDNTGSKGDRTRRIEILKSELVDFDLVQCRTVTRQLNFVMNQGNKKEHIKFLSASTLEPISGGLYALFVSSDATSTNSKYVLESKLTFYDN